MVAVASPVGLREGGRAGRVGVGGAGRERVHL